MAGMGTHVTVPKLPPCDLCREDMQKIVPARYDGKTIYGPWAYMCKFCWEAFGPGRLGTGFGQRLVLPNETEGDTD